MILLPLPIAHDITTSSLCPQMICAKKLIRVARKWQKMATIGRKRIPFPRTKGNMDRSIFSSWSVTDRGHFVVYSTDQIRFVIPLVCLQYTIFRELFRISEEEFGLPRDGPIMLPCGAVFVDYIMSLMTRGLAQDVEQSLLFSINSSCCSLPFVYRQEMGQEVVACGWLVRIVLWWILYMKTQQVMLNVIVLQRLVDFLAFPVKHLFL
ncbi:hypothetical protein Vadar_010963 [Vaccinium darrowii]|uniref:Uncharacterized protein n=1 Tax=Vaccinium darrowii TaxID=229202 RepID=A0ACB7WZY8_9ERIC|nr:hypothetical protein Vadar_010963 [Vaccinium darrowii]